MPEKETICVVEDNDTIRKLFVLLLAKGGYNVVQFANGEEAISWIEGNQPSILLCDILLPDINGSEVLQVVRGFKHGENIKAIALTAFARQGDREKYLEMGFDGYIAKPINPQSFLGDIQTIIAE